MTIVADKKWMIYGANGFTGKLIARKAHVEGLTPILAGRNEQEIVPLATELGVSYRIFALTNPNHIRESLQDIDVLLNCAGPFIRTSPTLIDECINHKVHYLDITGEINVFEYAQQQHDNALQNHQVICPGVGFDVIPTDCVAATLKNALPDANQLILGLDAEGALSPGTAKTGLMSLPQGGRVRAEGKLKTIPFASLERDIDFGTGIKHAVNVPWGEISTAWHSTRIPNIEVYISATPRRIKEMKRARFLSSLLMIKPLQRLLNRQIDKRFQAPDKTARETSSCHVWGEVRNESGNLKQAFLKTPDAYDLTVTGALTITKYLLEYEGTGGYFTPSKLMGASFVESLPGCSAITVISHQQGVLER